jgi:hypothetical protein
MATASWVIRNKRTGEVVMETFNKRLVAAINTEKYEAVPILDYLVQVNASLKAVAESALCATKASLL